MRDAPPESFRVLLIEDSAGDRFLLREMIERDCARFLVALVADTLASGIAMAREGGVDLVLLDLTLPDAHGLETFVRLHEVIPHVPVLVLSESDDEELGVQAVQR